MFNLDRVNELFDEIKVEIEKINLQKKSEFKPLAEFAGRVRMIRKQQGLTQEELADLAGISVGTLKRIEAGEYNVSLANFINVLNVLGIKLWIE